MDADTSSFEAFFEGQWQPLVAALIYAGDQGADAEDVAQEALAIAYANWQSVRQHPRPDGWVFLTAFRLARRGRRRRAVASRRSLLPLETTIAGLEDGITLKAVLDSLPGRQRAAVMLRHYYGLSTRETASLLRCREGTVKSLLARGRVSLREVMSVEEESQ